MKNYLLILVHVIIACVLLAAACASPEKEKIVGNWTSTDGHTHLKITSNSMIMDNDVASAEDYFIKGDTIFSSFKGNTPYTKFVIKKLDAKHLSLLYPDSVAIDFTR